MGRQGEAPSEPGVARRSVTPDLPQIPNQRARRGEQRTIPTVGDAVISGSDGASPSKARRLTYDELRPGESRIPRSRVTGVAVLAE
jgi:hypothetical protein